MDQTATPVASSGGRDAEECQPTTDPACEPAALIEPTAFMERAKSMLLGSGERPIASGDPPVASTATVGLVLSVKEIVDELWASHAAEIKRCCGPSMPKGLIDRQEVFGFVLCDALRREPLPFDAARDVGQAGDNAMAAALGSGKGIHRRKGKLEKAREATREAMRKAKSAAADNPTLLLRVAAAEVAGKVAEQAVRNELVDLRLPSATVGARKRQRTTEPPVSQPVAPRVTDTVPGPSHDGARRSSKERSVQRAQRRLDALGPEPTFSSSDRSLPPAADCGNPLACGFGCRTCERGAETRFEAAWAQYEKQMDPWVHAKAAVTAESGMLAAYQGTLDAEKKLENSVEKVSLLKELVLVQKMNRGITEENEMLKKLVQLYKQQVHDQAMELRCYRDDDADG